MSDLAPVDAAIAAYDANLNEQLGNPPGHVLGSDLRDSPPILAMLAAHETALREQVAKEIEAYQPTAHMAVCPPAIAWEAGRETAADIARNGPRR